MRVEACALGMLSKPAPGTIHLTRCISPAGTGWRIQRILMLAAASPPTLLIDAWYGSINYRTYE